jgi:hypothetical protein
MADQETYTMKLTKEEINSLAECLAEFRKYLAQNEDALFSPLFVAACELHYKTAVTMNPDTEVTLDDYLKLAP